MRGEGHKLEPDAVPRVHRMLAGKARVNPSKLRARGKDVSVQSEMNYALKMLQYIRAGARVNSRVEVRLEWNENGATHTVDGITMDISPAGCMVIAPQGFVVGQKLRVKNGRNQKESEATLIWRGHEGRTGWELGLELVHPPADFWGVEF